MLNTSRYRVRSRSCVGSRFWCLGELSFSYWYPGYLIVSIPDICTLTYLEALADIRLYLEAVLEALAGEGPDLEAVLEALA